ncbi:N-formylglutamate amidohydrolase [Emcibacter nanhaiensis]|uniref:N-formylglutamate amidohydrolase n=1 Tax=Emcibacter nanhaiensis TaxID=1505037 RepID=A0A501PIZ9_9PROT|nr:N-formylglutamate amidohydrolase [Emcibacter nanhaiensis]TPD59736.1 N-formylglutamate amidohydrolase [Emcibacter nanhaiensis]
MQQTSRKHATAAEQTEAYEILNPEGKANIVLICEHASNFIPEEFDNLGLSGPDLQRHIAWDIGMAEITRQMSEALDAPAILARFSRLLIDPNREPDHATLIPDVSDKTVIPGNRNLDQAATRDRLDRFYHPFHDRAEQLVRHKARGGHVPLVCGMHSFTPVMNGAPRPWHAGMLWNRDPRLARELIDRLQHKHGLMVGDNKPYSGRDLFHTMNRHGADHGYPQVTIEVRQNEINTAAGQQKWARLLGKELAELAQDRSLTVIKKF